MEREKYEIKKIELSDVKESSMIRSPCPVLRLNNPGGQVSPHSRTNKRAKAQSHPTPFYQLTQENNFHYLLERYLIIPALVRAEGATWPTDALLTFAQYVRRQIQSNALHGATDPLFDFQCGHGLCWLYPKKWSLCAVDRVLLFSLFLVVESSSRLCFIQQCGFGRCHWRSRHFWRSNLIYNYLHVLRWYCGPWGEVRTLIYSPIKGEGDGQSGAPF